MVRMKFAPERKCCSEEPEIGPCGCLLGTLPNTAANDVVISGVVMDEDFVGTFTGINETHVLDLMGSAPGFDGPVFCGYSEYDPTPDQVTIKLFFTRGEFGVPIGRMGLVFGESQIVRVDLPAGLKAVASMRLDAALGNPAPPDPFFPLRLFDTTAVFYKVLTDINGFFDCTDSISGFIFTKQVDAEKPTFDASSATVSYS